LFAQLMTDRLIAWLGLADDRLRPAGTRLYFMLGNDDPIELLAVLDRAPWGVHVEGKRVPVDDRHEMISWGFSNITPWHSHREQTEEQLAAALEGMASQVGDLANAIVNVHVPPYGTQLDEAPVLDADLRVVQQAGQVKFAPVGSTAVRSFLLEAGPLLGLHGHIHESSGIRRLGRTIAINPGSDYTTGTLNGALITLDRDKVRAHQLVRG
jgi:Icc-related predicted phosphoesterase